MTDATTYTSKLASARALIIGGSSGIGLAVAAALLEHGSIVAIASSTASKLAAARTSLLASYPSATNRLSTHVCDLSDTTTVEANIVALFAAVGPLNHVIHTAGDTGGVKQFSPSTVVASGDKEAEWKAKGGIHAATIESMQQLGVVRYYAAQLVAKHAARVLPPSPSSSITLTTGSVSEKPRFGYAVAAGTAVGLHGLARGLALDLAPIRVNTVSVGAVDTPIWDGLALSEEKKAALWKKVEEESCTGKVGSVEDVAEAYLYLMKDANCTGSVLRTDGGRLLK